MTLRGWTICAVAAVSFAAGSMTRALADSNRIFELRVYHVVPGKLPALEARFRDTASNLLAKHGMDAVGYWSPEDPAAGNVFVYMLAHPSMDAAKKNWADLFKDPDFQQMMKEEQAGKTVEKVDDTYLHPTDFSPMK